MKKTLLFLVLFSVLISIFSACSNKPSITTTVKPGDDTSVTIGNTDNVDSSSTDTTNSTPQTENTGIHAQYPNIVKIGDFYNGMASFTVKDGEKMMFGFIDNNENVVFDAIYELQKNTEPPSFSQSNYIKLTEKNSQTILYDKTGKAILTVGENGVNKIGTPTNGYFWVESVVEEFTGYVYTVTYYSSIDMKKVAEYPNSRASSWSADIDADGSALLDYNNGYSCKINISSHDPSFVPVDEYAVYEMWEKIIDGIDSFQGLSGNFQVSSDGQIAAVRLVNKDKIYYYTVIDKNGNVLMAPQKTICFMDKSEYNITGFDFCNNLCPALDETSGFWGYIDTKGNWQIEPQFSVARSFTTDGYAVVNDKFVIDTKGNIVIAPDNWNPKTIEITFDHTYTRSDGNEYYRIKFYDDGTIKMSNGYYGLGEILSFSGEYSLQGSKFIVSMPSMNIKFFVTGNSGTYSIYSDNGHLFIDGYKWLGW